MPSLSQLPPWRYLIIVGVPLLLVPLALHSNEARCAYVILVMAAFWSTKAIHFSITALIPVCAFPLLGVLSTDDVCMAYMREANMVFLGSSIVAIAMEYSQLSKRVAIFLLLRLRQSLRLLMLCFMVTTMFLSILISNTATTALMMPFVDAVLQELYKIHGPPVEDAPRQDDDPLVAPHHQSKDPITEACADSAVSHSYISNVSDEFCNGGAVAYPMSMKSSYFRDTKPPEEDDTIPFSPPPSQQCTKLRDMLYLATAYAANLGGTATLHGMGPNLILKGVMDRRFPSTNIVNFKSWLSYNAPGMLLCGALAWCWLHVLFLGVRGTMLRSDKQREAAVERVLRRKYRQLGAMSAHEVIVLVLFVALVLLWLFRSPGFMVGWADVFEESFPGIHVDDATPVMLIVFLLFILPKQPRCFRGVARTEELPGLEGNNSIQSSSSSSDERCLSWEAVRDKLPWGIVLLLGGGFAMAEAADKSNMSRLIGDQLGALAVLPKEAIVFIITLMTAMLTEAASNTATASILMPVLKDLSIGIEVNPVYMMLPPAVACSYAFMLPVATPPNAIVFGAANMKAVTMLKAGVVMNVICVLVATLMVNTLGVAMFDLNSFPDWAVAASNSSLA